MEPLVSILIPAHNAAKWIAEAIRSAAGQTWRRKEIILVDDGSTDDTPAIARQFTSPKIAVLTQPNQGASAARNAAFAHCQGDYIQWLDADDVLAPDKIELQLKSLPLCGNEHTLLSCAWGRFLTSPWRATFTPTTLWNDLSPVEWMLRKMEQNIYMQTSTWLVSRELTQAAGPWDKRLWVDDDGEYFTRVVLAGERVHFVQRAQTFYRDSGAESLSRIGLSQRKQEAQLLSVELNIGHLRAVDQSERVREACRAYLQTNINYIRPEDPVLLQRAERLAASLGSQLALPSLSWKHALLKNLFGREAARNARFHYHKLKATLASLHNP